MNIFAEAKNVLDKDGKVNALGPYGKNLLVEKCLLTSVETKLKMPQLRKQ